MLKKSKKANSNTSPQTNSHANPSATHQATHQNTSQKFAYPILILAGVVVVAVLVVLVLSSLSRSALNEEFFTSTDTKSVINFTSDDSTTANHSMHVVYEYNGDKVTSMKTYFEYDDAKTARTAYESNKNLEEFKNSELKDNFIIVTADPNEFEGLTADDVRQQEEAIKQFQATNNPSSNSEDSENSEE